MMKRINRPFGLLAAAVLLATGMAGIGSASASEPFIAEVSMFGGNFAPRNWAFCNGQVLPIASNTALFSLVGTTYGGDGRTTLRLPNLQGRFAMHPGRGPGLTARSLGQVGGADRVALTIAQMPSHTHGASAQMNAYSGQGRQDVPEGNVPAADRREDQYSDVPPDVSMAAPGTTVAETGGGQSHENMPPFLGIHHIIALQGLYPSRS